MDIEGKAYISVATSKYQERADVIADAVKHAGIQVHVVPVYHVVIPDDGTHKYEDAMTVIRSLTPFPRGRKPKMKKS